MSYTAAINLLCVVIVVEALSIGALVVLLAATLWLINEEAHKRLDAVTPAWLRRRLDNG